MLSNLDLRFALRLLIKDRIFCVTTLLTLSLGIGAFTAVFALYDTALLRPLPYHRSDELVRVFMRNLSNGRERNPTLEEFLQLRETTRSLEALAAFAPEDLTLIGPERTEAVRAMEVTADFFELLGTPALKGRYLLKHDFSGQSRAALISFDLWQRFFVGAESTIGSTVSVRSLSVSAQTGFDSLLVVGVMPASFGMDRVPDARSRFFDVAQTNERGRAQIWLPMNAPPEALRSKRPAVIARLKENVAIPGAESDANFIAPNEQTAVGVISLRESLMGKDGLRLLNILLLAGAFVLLTCSLNAANLFAAHLSRNYDQYAILAVLGASSSRLSQVLLFQGLFISLLAGLFGIGASGAGLALLKTFPSSAIPRLDVAGLHLEVWLLTILLSGLLGSLSAVVLHKKLSRNSLTTALSAGSTVVGRYRGWLPKGAVVLQLALTLCLLISAGLLLQSFVKLLSVDPGFRTEDVLVFSVPFPYRFVPSKEPLARYQLKIDQILNHISSIPGVERAATGSVPLRNLLGGGVYSQGSEEMKPVFVNPVSADFFRLLDISVLEGRVFGPQDSGQTSRKVVVISQSLAKQLWNGESALGKQIRFNPTADEGLAVVGVVQDIRRRGLHISPSAEIYLPFLQSQGFADCQFLVRTRSKPSALVPAIRRTLRSFDRSLALAEIQSLTEVVSNSTSHRRLVLWLVGTFAVISLLVASVGVYGVVAYYVSYRRREFGLRIAVGATKADIVRLCLAQGLRPLAIGGVLGFGGALLLAQKTAYLLYETSPTDPVTYSGVLILLMGIGMLASFVPAFRAAQVDAYKLLKVE